MSNPYKVLYADTNPVFLEVAEATAPDMWDVACTIVSNRTQIQSALDEETFDLVITGGRLSDDIHAVAAKHPRRPPNHVILLDDRVQPLATPGLAMLGRWRFGFESVVTHARNGDWQTLTTPPPPLYIPPVIEPPPPPKPRLRVLYLGHAWNIAEPSHENPEAGSVLVKGARLYRVCSDLRLDFAATAAEATRLIQKGGTYDLIFAEHGAVPQGMETQVIALDPRDTEGSYKLFSETVDARRKTFRATPRPL
jgi:hypothetical protein